MTKPGTSDAGKMQLRFLLLGGSEQDFADLRGLFARTSGEQLHLEHAASPEDVLAQIGKESYDLLLCSNQSTDNAAFQLLRQVRRHYSGVPLIFLSEPASKGSLQVAIRGAA